MTVGLDFDFRFTIGGFCFDRGDLFVRESGS